MLRFILVLKLLLGCSAQPGLEPENKGEQTNDLPIKLMRDAQDYAYHAHGEATEARAASHEARGKIAARKTGEANARTAISHGINSGYLAPVKAQTVQTDASAATAVDWHSKTRAVVDQTDALAYAAATASAQAKVAELKAGAAAYYQELLAALHAKAGGPKDPKFAAASAAAKPYFALEIQTMGVVETYFIFCNDLMSKVKANVKAAFGVANEANLAQAQGNADIALRKMVMAHGMIVKANEEEGLAKNVYKLATSINSAIPAYSQSAAVAAEHAYAMTFLQGMETSAESLGSQQPKRNPFVAKTKTSSSPDATSSSEQVVVPPSDARMLQLKKTGDEIEESMRSFDIDNDKLAKELDKFSLHAEADTEKSLAEAQKVADFLSRKVLSDAGKGRKTPHATN